MNTLKIIEQLLNDAQPDFHSDFPQSIQKAPDFAKISGIEVSVLQDILFNGIHAKFIARGEGTVV